MPAPNKHFVLLGAPGRPDLGARTESPEARLFNSSFAAWGIPADFRDLPLAGKSLGAVLTDLRRSVFSGGVVAPGLQLEIMPLLDKLSPAAQRVGAVDTLYWEGQSLVGHNTLADALAYPLYQQKISAPALIICASDNGGPLARNALSALLSFPEITEISLCACAREAAECILTSTRAAEIDEHAPHKISPTIRKKWLSPVDLENYLPKLLINCRGLAADRDRPFDIPAQVYQEKGLAYDLVSSGGGFLASARDQGWATLDGRSMFLSSAKEQFILWTGLPLPDISEQKIGVYLPGNTE